MIGGQAARRAVTLNWDSEDVTGAGLAILRRFRPDDGWVALILLALNLCVVVLSVEQADWAPTPSLIGILLLGMLTAFVFYRIPVFWFQAMLPGLVLGGLTVVWQLSDFTFDGEQLGGAGALWDRLALWMEAAKESSINIDKVPFAFGLVTAAWLTGYVGAWVFLRHRNFWGVFALSGLGLFSNLTFLPPNTNFHLALYLFTALLLVARVQAVRRQSHWDRQGIRYDDGLKAFSLSDSFFLAVAVIVVALLLPAGGRWSTATGAYETIRRPFVSLEDDFNRLFAGLPARRDIGFRVWDDVMAFQGTISPAATHTLLVDSPVPMYWKARTYDMYTGKGWISLNTELRPIDYTPDFIRSETLQDRVNVTYAVTPLYSSDYLFAGPQVTAVDRDVQIETPSVPLYRVDVSRENPLLGHPPVLAEAGRALSEKVRLNPAVSEAELQALLALNFRVAGIERQEDRISAVTIEEALLSPPEALSVRSTKGRFPTHDPYVVTSSLAIADPDQLRAAGVDYPAHILHRYTQLPPDLPGRVGGLAHEITVDAETPFDKAVLIEKNLQRLEYNLEIDPPPFDADGVDHFLFNQRQGYSEYFASAMAVLLRTVGVPARVAVGYTTGEPTDVPNIYAVADNNSHGWVEVYFPGYSWIAFEPTPGVSLPAAMVPGEGGNMESAGGFFSDFDVDCLDDFVEDCLDYAEPFADLDGTSDEAVQGGGTPGWVWVLVVLGGLAVAGFAAVWGFRRYMFASYDPAGVYGRMRALASLGGLAGTTQRTPYQFGQRLSRLLPMHQDRVAIIVEAYVQSRYGARTLSEENRRQLADAWLNLRFPLLMTAVGYRIYPRIES